MSEVKIRLRSKLPIKLVTAVSNAVFFRGKIFGVCTANPSDCPVHATYIPRTKWAFFENVDTVDKLLASLNERGFRESALRNILLQDKERISESIQKCSVHRLDHSKPDIQQINEVRKSTRQTRKEKEYDINMHFPAGTPIEQIFERTFVDMILETEEKIFVGGLGALKVCNVHEFVRNVVEYHKLICFY